MHVDQDRLALGVQLLSLVNRGAHLGDFRHRYPGRAHALCDLRVVARHVRHVVLLTSGRETARVGRHPAVVQQDRRDRHTGLRRRRDVEPGHAERAVAHVVQAEPVRVRQLGSDHERNPEPKVRRLAPADVTVRIGRRKEGHHRVPGSAGVVGHRAVLEVDVFLDLVNHAIGAERLVVHLQHGRPLLHPLRLHRCDLRRNAGVTAALSDLALDLIDHRLDREPCVADQRHVGWRVLVHIVFGGRVVDDRLPAGHGLRVAVDRQAGAEPQDDI